MSCRGLLMVSSLVSFSSSYFPFPSPWNTGTADRGRLLCLDFSNIRPSIQSSLVLVLTLTFLAPNRILKYVGNWLQHRRPHPLQLPSEPNLRRPFNTTRSHQPLPQPSRRFLPRSLPRACECYECGDGGRVAWGGGGGVWGGYWEGTEFHVG